MALPSTASKPNSPAESMYRRIRILCIERYKFCWSCLPNIGGIEKTIARLARNRRPATESSPPDQARSRRRQPTGEPPMASYRAFLLQPDNHIQNVMPLDCADDHTAIAQASL